MSDPFTLGIATLPVLASLAFLLGAAFLFFFTQLGNIAALDEKCKAFDEKCKAFGESKVEFKKMERKQYLLLRAIDAEWSKRSREYSSYNAFTEVYPLDAGAAMFDAIQETGKKHHAMPIGLCWVYARNGRPSIKVFFASNIEKDVK